MAKSGDTLDSIFLKLYKEYSQLVMGIVFSILKDKGLAEDAFQAAFLKIAKNINKITGPPEKTKNYITKIARSSAIDIYRKYEKIRQNEIALIEETINDENDNGIKSDIESELSIDSFEQTIFLKYDRIRLLKSLDRLDKKYSIFIKEYYYDGLTISQIAEKHGISETAAYKRLYRSIDKLKKIFFKGEIAK